MCRQPRRSCCGNARGPDDWLMGLVFALLDGIRPLCLTDGIYGKNGNNENRYPISSRSHDSHSSHNSHRQFLTLPPKLMARPRHPLAQPTLFNEFLFKRLQLLIQQKLVW